ncbi:MAG: hypothetical protein JNL87_09545 [Burkholderiaceae bacterium]|nr:hypothetical protein [Burkholderiaceae bacterium]
MQPFLHGRLQSLERLLARASEVLAKYNRLDLDLAPALTGFLDDAIATQRALQRGPAENELLALKAQFVAAEHGVHPVTLERATGHRRELVRGVALRVLQQSAEQLRNDIARDRQRLDEASVQLRPIVLLAFRQGLITSRTRRPMSNARLETLWRDLLREPDVALAARQLAMQLSLHDILLLLADLVDASQQISA